jgi:hypothetical protein
MDLEAVIIEARKQLGGNMESSARLCLADAIRHKDEGNWELSAVRALKSIAYSVGIMHPAYSKAWKMVRGETKVGFNCEPPRASVV